MRFCFHYRQPFPCQLDIAEALKAGAAAHGDIIEPVAGFVDVVSDCDGLILFGTGGISRQIFDAYRRAGKTAVLLDKGYSGSPYNRVSINGSQPVAYLDQRYPSDRFDRLRIDLKPYRIGTHVLLNGASYKSCVWEKLPDWVIWGGAMVQTISNHSYRPIIYRPKPNQMAPIPVDGAELSVGPLADDFSRTAVAVSWGGNFGWYCAINGVPHFAFADSVALALSETDLAKIDQPRIPSNEDRHRWCSAVAYWQWTEREMASGEMWEHLRKHIP